MQRAISALALTLHWQIDEHNLKAIASTTYKLIDDLQTGHAQRCVNSSTRPLTPGVHVVAGIAGSLPLTQPPHTVTMHG
jgi:hypothetical protein